MMKNRQFYGKQTQKIRETTGDIKVWTETNANEDELVD